MSINVTKEAILIDGIATESIANGLAATGMAQADIINLIGHMYVGYVGGKGRPAFRFATDVQAADADCDATFDRTFDHVDWVDGVSRVQAGMTPEELGFNARFHAIENDLDAIAQQFRRMSSCTKELRSDLRGVVKELEAKITDLETQIRELKSSGGGGGRPPGGGSVFQPGVWEFLGAAKVNEKDVIVARLGEQIVMSEVVADMISKGTVLGGGGRVRDDIVVGGGGVVFDPLEDVVVPRAGFFVAGDRIIPGHGGAIGFQDVIAINDALERRVASGGGEHSIGEVVARGDDLVKVVGSGLDAGEVVTEAGFVNLATERLLSSAPAEERRALRDSVLNDDVADRTGSALLSSGVVGLTPVSETDAAVLAAAGFSRIGNLSNATVAEVMSGIEGTGGSLEESRVREAVAAARVARAVRRG